jgi:hypothetical protein
MRNIKYIIAEAKENTNTKDIEAISDSLCIRLLNRSQEFIQAFMFTKNTEAKIFRKTAAINVDSSTDSYALPHDIYAKNSINNVFYKVNDSYSLINQISEKSRSTNSGYFCSDSNIVIVPFPRNPMELMVSYTRRLPSVGLSYGKISRVNTNLSIVLDDGFGEIQEVDDMFSIVDSSGNVIRYGLPANQDGDTINVPDTSNILVGMIVVPGKYSTTHSQLPDELESSLVSSLEFQINARLSSTDIAISKSINDETLGIICDMFADNQTDTFIPPITEYSEWV